MAVSIAPSLSLWQQSPEDNLCKFLGPFFLAFSRRCLPLFKCISSMWCLVMCSRLCPSQSPHAWWMKGPIRRCGPVTPLSPGTARLWWAPWVVNTILLPLLRASGPARQTEPDESVRRWSQSHGFMVQHKRKERTKQWCILKIRWSIDTRQVWRDVGQMRCVALWRAH